MIRSDSTSMPDWYQPSVMPRITYYTSDEDADVVLIGDCEDHVERYEAEQDEQPAFQPSSSHDERAEG